MTERIGLCGGSFDPFHLGHLQPLAVYDEMRWTQVLYIPANRQPFKAKRIQASPFHRFSMAVLGTEDDERLGVSPIEVEREGVSYTVHTLELIRNIYPAATLDWIIGDDNLESLNAWKSIDHIFERANFVVLARSESSTLGNELASRVIDADSRRSAGGIIFAHNPAMAVSSTEIRQMVARGEPVEHLVGDRVARYIRRNGLYRVEES